MFVLTIPLIVGLGLASLCFGFLGYWFGRVLLKSSQQSEASERIQELESHNRALLAEAASKLTETEERFRATFEHSAIGLAHVSSSGRFLRVNSQLCQMLGYSSEELLAKTFPEITHPDDLEPDMILVRRTLAGEIATYTIEKRYLTSRGDFVWVNLTVSLLRDAQGEPDYFIVTIENINARKFAEQQLVERDQQLAMVFDEGSVGDWTWDIDSDVVTAHGSVWRMYGAMDSVSRRPAAWFRARQHPSDIALIEAGMREFLAGNKPLDMEFRVVWPNGTIRWLACRGSLVRNKSGRPVQVHGLNVDITALKAAQSAVQRSEEEFRQITNAMPQLVWISSPSGSIDYYNDRWYEYTGQNPDQALNSGWQNVIHPDDLADCLRRWRVALGTGEAYEVEYRLRREDGNFRWFLGRGLPLREESGHIVRWFGSCTDIDDMKQAATQVRHFNQQLELRVVARTSELLRSNQELIQTKARLQSVLDSATQVAIIVLDDHGVIQLFNAGAEYMVRTAADHVVGVATMHRFEREEERLERSRELSLHRGRDIAISEIYDSNVLPAHAYTRQTVFIRSDGLPISVSLATAPILDDRGRRTGTLVVATDITRRVELEAELTAQTRNAEAANLAKSEFLAAMSHEIRTPMNAILGMADLLWDTQLTAAQRQYVERFRRAGSSLLTLINDILDLSKIEAGRFELERIKFDLEDVVREVSDLMTPHAEAKRLSFRYQIDSGVSLSLIGDPARLQQVLINLVGNAIKFTDRGEVMFLVKPYRAKNAAPDQAVAPNHLLFEVHDTGIGIPQDKLQAIFEDFTQADSSITRRFGGTGLGLSIARRLVRRLGGDLTVTSKLGEGTIFCFDVEFQPGRGYAAAPKPTVQHLASRRVLIVDNDETNRIIFTQMCSSWGMEAASHKSAKTALPDMVEARQHGEPYEILLLDVLLQEVDGFDLVEQFRAIEPKLPIILTSSDDQIGDAARAQLLGLSYARKPLRRADLLRLISANLPPHPGGWSGDQLFAVEETTGEFRRIRVLAAEDSEDNRFLLVSYFSDPRFELVLVENGADALEQFRSAIFDIVLLDVQMPIVDGLTAASTMRSIERDSGRLRTPILALTANALRGDVERSAAAGCDAHLSKPIKKSTLLNAIETWLGGRPLKVTSASRPRVMTTDVNRFSDPSISIPHGLEAAARRYIRTRISEVAHLRELLRTGEFDEFRLIAHKMKGAGQSFGFPPLTTFGAQMETAAKKADVPALMQSLDEMSEYVDYAASIVLAEESRPPTTQTSQAVP